MTHVIGKEHQRYANWYEGDSNDEECGQDSASS